MIKRACEVVGAVVYEGWCEVVYFFAINMRYIANLISIAVPYGMYILGQYLALERGTFAVGGELFLPVVIALLVNGLRGIANKTNKGARIPKPDVRFTDVSEDGEVSVREERLPEMLLYMADLEDWMERKGWL